MTVENDDIAELVDKFVACELDVKGIKPGTPAAREFQARVNAFGVMGVQPPRPELNIEQPTS